MVDAKTEQINFADTISRILISRQTTQDICDGFAKELKSLIDVDWAIIALVDDTQEGGIHLSPLSAAISSEWASNDSTSLISESVKVVSNSRTAVVANNLKGTSPAWATSSLVGRGINSLVYMPLISKGEVYGSLVIGSLRPAAYQERELSLLKYAVTQLSLPLRLEFLQEKALEEAKVAVPPITHEPEQIVDEPSAEPTKEPEVSTEHEQPIDMVTFGAILAEESRRVVEERFSTIIEEALAKGAENREKVSQQFESLLSEANAGAQRYFDTYLEEGRKKAEEEREKVKQEFTTLIEQAKISSKEEKEEAEEQLSTLLQNAQREAEETLRSMEEETKRKAEETFIRSLTGLITYSPDSAMGLDGFGKHLKTRIQFDRISLTLIHEEGVRLYWAFPEASDGLKKGQVLPLRDCGATWVAEHKQTHIENDIAAEMQFAIDKTLSQSHDIRSIIRVPLLSGRGILGALNLMSKQPNAFGDEDRQFLEKVCSELTPPLERICFQTRERERIAFLNATLHEVRTPLTSILASSKLLQEELQQSPVEAQIRLITNIVQSANHMENRVSQFFDLARIQATDFDMDTELVEVDSIIQEAALQIIPKAQNKKQLLLVEISQSLPKVKCNRFRMLQVLSTLLSNAITFSPEGGRVGLKVTTRDQQIIVEIQDSGIAFSPEEKDNLFRAYSLSKVDSEKFPELRLGLALAKLLIELHGGNLWMSESEEYGGNTCAFSLPAYE